MQLPEATVKFLRLHLKNELRWYIGYVPNLVDIKRITKEGGDRTIGYGGTLKELAQAILDLEPEVPGHV